MHHHRISTLQSCRVRCRMYQTQVSAPSWKPSELRSWQLLGAFHDPSHEKGGTAKLYRTKDDLRLLHSLLGPLDLEGRVVASEVNGTLKIAFDDVHGLLSPKGIEWSNGIFTPRYKEHARQVDGHAHKKLSAEQDNATENALRVLGQWMFPEAVQSHKQEIGALVGAAPLDWKDIAKGRHLFISDWGPFDIQRALAEFHESSGSSLLIPSVVKLRALGYFQRFLIARETRLPKAPPLDEEHALTLQRIFQSPCSAFAKYVRSHQTFFFENPNCNRLDELEHHFHSLPGNPPKSKMKTLPEILLNQIQKERHKLSWGLDGKFHHLLHWKPIQVSSPTLGNYELRILSSRHEVIQAGEAFNNCARMKIPKIMSKECLLAVLSDRGKDVAMGQWHVKDRKWIQMSENSNKTIRKEWRSIFRTAGQSMPILHLNLKMQLTSGSLYDDVLNSTTANLLYDVLCDALHTKELDVRKHTQLLIGRHVLSQLSSAHLKMGGPNFASVMLPFAAAQGLDNVVRSLLKAGANLESEVSFVFTSGKRLTGTPLLVACGLGNWKIVSMLAEHGADLHAQASSGETCLRFAVEAHQWDLVDQISESSEEGVLPLACLFGDLQTIQHLIKDGHAVNVTDRQGFSALAIAVRRGDRQIVYELLQAGSDIHARDKLGRTPLLWSLQERHSHVADLLMEHGASCNVKDSIVIRALLSFCRGGQLSTLESLFILGASANSHDSIGRTPLIAAVQGEQATVVEFLLSEGANVHAHDNHGQNALGIALNQGCYGIAERLAHAGAVVSGSAAVASRKLVNRMLAAARQEDFELVACFANAGVRTGPEFTKLNREVYFAARSHNIGLLQSLVKLGVNVNGHSEQNDQGIAIQKPLESRFNHQDTPLIASAVAGYLGVAKLLVKSGADVDKQDALGRTALMHALQHNHRELVKVLVQAGASISVKDNRGRTALERLPRGQQKESRYFLASLGIKD